MPRKNLIRQSIFPYHVYIRSNNRTWFYVPLYKMWELCFECLDYALKKTPVHLHAFVLMGNHYHLLLTTPNSDLDKFMEHFNKRLSQRMKQESGAENHKFANRYKWTIIETQAYLFNIYRYIYQNPVRARLCQFCIDYPYSSLRFSPAQLRKLKFTQHICYFKFREWMECYEGSEFDETIKKGLRRQTFKIANSTRRPIENPLKSLPA